MDTKTVMNHKESLLEAASTSPSAENQSQGEPNRREFLAGLTGIVALTALEGARGMAQDTVHALNIARVAVPSSLTRLSENKISALNDGFTPESSFDRSHGIYALRQEDSNESTSSWVQYEWTERVSLNKVEVYWAVDHPKSGAIPGSSSLQKMQVPLSYRILYWNESNFVPVAQPQGS